MSQFTAVNQNLDSAVDQTASPVWCMVPARGRKVVRLLQDNGLTLQLLPGATATGIQWTETRGPGYRDIEIRAQQPGEATLQAVSGLAIMATLDISVLPRKEFKISVRFVYDKMGAATGRSLSLWSFHQDEIERQMTILNRIFLPQVNLNAKLSGMGPTHVSDDLTGGFLFREQRISGKELNALKPKFQITAPGGYWGIGCVSRRLPGPEGCDPAGLEEISDASLRFRIRALDLEYNLVRRSDPNADFTFLLINKLVNAPDVGAYTKGGCCILPDTVLPAVRSFVMAHEFGHYLLGRRPVAGGRSEAWHTQNRQDLMFPNLATYAHDLGFRIRKTEVLQMAKRSPK